MKYQFFLKAIRKNIATVALLLAFTPINSNANDHWRFYAIEKESHYLLGEKYSTNRNCKGMKEASQQRLVLNEWKYIRELCYEVSNSGKIKFLDPEKIFPFNRFEISASNFVRIPTREERAVAEDARRIEAIRRSLNETSRARPDTLLGSDSPSVLMIDGDLKICHRIGGIVDCF